MNLVASLIVRDELGRYLRPCIQSLLSFCEGIRVLDDSSSDGSYEWLIEQAGVQVRRNPGQSFFAHEGRARQRLFEWTMEARPSHILAIDADEFIADPAALRSALETGREHAWLLTMEEVWQADADWLQIRTDGGWRPHLAPILYRAPANGGGNWLIRDRALACGREPLAVHRLIPRHPRPTTEILHFGWANPSERATRYERYATHDGGRYHQNRHIQSIMWPPKMIRLRRRPWPTMSASARTAILERTGEGRPR